MSRPSLVLFDLDGVLVHYDQAARVRTLARRVGASEDDVDQALFRSGAESAADRGELDTDGVVAALSDRLGRPVTLADCLAARADAMRANADVLALADRAARRAQVAILTNNGLMLRDHFAPICPALAPRFEGRVFCSAQFRRTKPDPAVFRDCLAAIGVAPAQALFVDDKAANAEGARAAGLLAHHFRDAGGLAAVLQAHDLLEPAP